jgi:hypothetical protein
MLEKANAYSCIQSVDSGGFKFTLICNGLLGGAALQCLPSCTWVNTITIMCCLWTKTGREENITMQNCQFWQVEEEFLCPCCVSGYWWNNCHPIPAILIHGAEPFLRSCQLCTYSWTSQHFMEPEGLQEPSTGPDPEPDQSHPSHPSKIQFSIVRPPTSWSS